MQVPGVSPSNRNIVGLQSARFFSFWTVPQCVWAKLKTNPDMTAILPECLTLHGMYESMRQKREKKTAMDRLRESVDNVIRSVLGQKWRNFVSIEKGAKAITITPLRKLQETGNLATRLHRALQDFARARRAFYCREQGTLSLG